MLLLPSLLVSSSRATWHFQRSSMAVSTPTYVTPSACPSPARLSCVGRDSRSGRHVFVRVSVALVHSWSAKYIILYNGENVECAWLWYGLKYVNKLSEIFRLRALFSLCGLVSFKRRQVPACVLYDLYRVYVPVTLHTLTTIAILQLCICIWWIIYVLKKMYA